MFRLKIFLRVQTFRRVPPVLPRNFWQRGVGSLQGPVTAARSWPLFREEKNELRRCWKKLGGHNFDLRDFRAKYKMNIKIYIKIFSQEDFALNSKLWPPSFFQHLPIFAGNSRSTDISQLRAGKTRSKRPRSHCLSTMHLLPYMWAPCYPLDPSR